MVKQFLKSISCFRSKNILLSVNPDSIVEHKVLKLSANATPFFKPDKIRLSVWHSLFYIPLPRNRNEYEDGGQREVTLGFSLFFSCEESCSLNQFDLLTVFVRESKRNLILYPVSTCLCTWTGLKERCGLSSLLTMLLSLSLSLSLDTSLMNVFSCLCVTSWVIAPCLL